MPDLSPAETVFSVFPASVRAHYVALVRARVAGIDPPNPDREREIAAEVFVAIPENVRARFAQLAEREAQLTAAAATREAAAKLPPSPEQLLAEAEEALAKEQRTEADAAAWEAARAKYGRGRVGKIPTVDGVIVMRVIAGAEFDLASQRIEGAPAPQRLAIARETTLDGIVYPDRETARARADRWPGIWLKMYELRDALASGEEDALVGKA